jgi:hypothetical protein
MMTDIDPQQFGRLTAQVEALESQVGELQADMKSLLELANKSKGGFWMGMAIASAVGGMASFAVSHVGWK